MPRPKRAADCCAKPHKAFGLCVNHYEQAKRRARGLRKRRPGHAPTRFWGKVKQGEWDDCWVWTGQFDRHGYGKFSVGGKTVYAHRFAYQDMVGDIPEGLVLDHLCRHPACVNPWHLDPVTNVVNIKRARGTEVPRDACRNGHPYTDETVYVLRGIRFCRTCNALAQQRRKERLAERVA